MLKDPRAKQSVANFHAQWLELNKLEGAAKDPTLFPEFDATLRLRAAKGDRDVRRRGLLERRLVRRAAHGSRT